VDAVADASKPTRAPIRAGGGVVGRAGQILVVHRPRFDDWSLPKGKLKTGEHPLAGAVREVREETGVLGVPGVRLPTARYEVWSGDALVPKHVDYWAMTVGSEGTFAPTDEVDDIAWLPARRALDVLTYPHDRRVVAAFGDLPRVGRPVVLLRHARARADRARPHGQRPLDAAGERQAAAIARLLPLFEPRRLLSAASLPCRQTLADLSRVVGTEVEVEDCFDEGADPGAAAAALRALGAANQATVVCGHGGIIRAAVARLSGRPKADHAVVMGDGLVLSFSGDTLAAADPFTPEFV
jgi:8-oxo-dGTP diphosphatase